MKKYIGQRYLMYIPENNEWNINQKYEHFTVVLHEGNSYISRIDVPKGIDITNKKYWALFSNYDVNMQNLEEEFNNFKNFYNNEYGALKNDIYNNDKFKKDISTLFVRNDGIINKNINNCFNSENGEFRANESGQYLIMCSGYELPNSSTYVACVVSGISGNQNKLYTSGSSGFTFITLEKDQTLSLYTCVAGNINQNCVSSMAYINMLIAKIN